MTSLVTKSFAKFDIFGSEVGLNYQKDSIFKTNFGGFMSLSFFAFLGIFFWNSVRQIIIMHKKLTLFLKLRFSHFQTEVRILFLKDATEDFSKQDPKKYYDKMAKKNVIATSNKQFYTDPPVATLNAKNFMFAVQIGQKNFLENPYLNISFETRNYVTLKNGTKVRHIYPAQLEPCTPEHWSQLPQYGINWTDSFYRFNFQQFLCPTKDYEFLLGGSYNSENFYHWKFSITKCRNDSLQTAFWKPICKSAEEVDLYFNKTQNIRFNIYTSNYLINALESNNYVNNFIEDSMFFQIQNKNSYITSDIYLSENIIQTDQSLLPFPSITNQTFITFESGNYRPQYIFGQIGDVYADFFIRKDAFVYTKNRAFQKISQIISYIGGFAQIFILVTAILDLKQENKNQVLTEQVDFENPDIRREDKQQEADICVQKQKSIQAIQREDDGLLPLDQLKEIIFLRKEQIKQQQVYRQKQPIQNQQQKLFKTEEQIELEEEEEENVNQIQDRDKLSINLNENQVQEMKQPIYNIENMLGYDQQSSAHKIEQKVIMNESIYPDNPLEAQINNISEQNNDFKKGIQIVDTDYKNQVIQEKQPKLVEIYQRQQSNSMAKQVESIQNFNQNYTATNENAQITSNQTFNKINTPSNYLSKETPKSKFHSQNSLLLHGLGYKNQRQFLSREFQFLLKKRVTLQMTLKYFLYKLTCQKFFKTEQVLLLDKANKQMKQDLDILNIINRLKEIEKFKKLFLDKNQEILFNFFPKPIISVENDKHNLTRAEIEEQVKQNIKRDSELNINLMKSLKLNEKQQKKLRINLKLATVVQKAVMKFKKPLTSKSYEQNTINTYNILYEAYEKLIAERQNRQNKVVRTG